MVASSAARLSIAAAHGFTARTIATWSESIARTPRVLVPVAVDALVVRQAGGAWADCALRPAPGSGKASRLDLLPPPFGELAEPRAVGVHLHWALPDGLTHGAQANPTIAGSTSDPATTFPAIPDRWLVLRISPSVAQPARRAVRGWVLQSDLQVPVVTDLDAWREPGPRADRLAQPFTALGHGDMAWAAYYDNVLNRLAFHDPLSDVSDGPLAYVVCGWFSDPDLDPLGSAAVRSLTDFDARMLALRWQLAAGELHESVDATREYVGSASMIGLGVREVSSSAASGRSVDHSTAAPIAPPLGAQPAALDASGHPIGGSYTTDSAWWPTQTVYHGSVMAIGWPGPGYPGSDTGLINAEVGGPPDPSTIRVAIGSTSLEALGAVVAAANATPDEARILDAFMLGALPELAQPDGRAKVDARLHADAFGSMDGGATTETIRRPATPATPPLPTTPVAPDPGIFNVPAGSPSPSPDIVDSLTPAVGPPSPVSLNLNPPPELSRESAVVNGGLAAAKGALPKVEPPPILPAADVDVRRSLPRRFHPADPAILVQGGARSFKHGGDGRLNPEGMLICRLTGFCITELSCRAEVIGPQTTPDRPTITGEDILVRGVENGSVPLDCEALLIETVLLDPGGSATASQASFADSTAVAPAQLESRARNFAVEQTAWWATRDPRIDPAPLVAASGVTGTLPSAIAVTPPLRPWTPIHLDWRVQFIPSPQDGSGWTLGETDYEPDAKLLPPTTDTTSGTVLEGRAHLTGGAATAAAQAVRTALKSASSVGGTGPLIPGTVGAYSSTASRQLIAAYNAISPPTSNGAASSSGGAQPVDRTALADLASALESMDVLTGAFDSFTRRLRGGFPGDGVAAPVSDQPAPSPFFPFRSGFLRVLRLRLVDCFGQFVDLAGSSDQSLVDSTQLVLSEPMQVADRPDLAALPSRFTAPARLWFRYLAGDGSDADASATTSPVCGYLMPNHLDGALEVFGDDGLGLGVVRPEPGAGIIWEDAPGQPSTVGQTPARAVPNSFVAGLAQGLINWGLADAATTGTQENALSALLRIIDSTLWSVDPFGHAGDEHLSLLLGHPVVVVRARVRLEVEEPIDPSTVAQMRVPLRLGALTHWQDGLLGYFVNDDYTTLHCADAAVAGFARPIGPGQGFLQAAPNVQNYYQHFANDLGDTVTSGSTPVTHPYVDDSGTILIPPNQEVRLTLLIEPHCSVHATAGLVPRKEIGLRREWIAAALAKLAPTFRFGPVLVDPKRIRMPIPTDLQGSWSWDHRAAVASWAEDEVVNASSDALLPDDPAVGQEGWLKMTPQTTGGNAS